MPFDANEKERRESLRGLRTERCRSNVKEALIASAWSEYHWNKANLIEAVLGGYLQPGGKDITNRDLVLASTLIQWLGTPVGFRCLSHLVNQMGFVLEEAPLEQWLTSPNRDERETALRIDKVQQMCNMNACVIPILKPEIVSEGFAEEDMC